MAKARGLYANIHAKRKRIAAGSGEKMKRPGQKEDQQQSNLLEQLKLLRKEHNEKRTQKRNRRTYSKG